jgi:DNA-binding MarR family transcriptional regulator
MLAGRDDDLDPLLLDPTRLSIVAFLVSLSWTEFSAVRDAVGLSDSALSKQASTLERSDYVRSRKGYVGKRPRTWLCLTDAGRDALSAHVRALQRIVDRSAAAAPPAGSPPADPGGESRPRTGTTARAD